MLISSSVDSGSIRNGGKWHCRLSAPLWTIGDNDVEGDGCYSPAVAVDVPVLGFTATEFGLGLIFS